MGPWLLSVTGVTLPSARGMALGLAAHAVGTSLGLEEGEETGAFAALGMSLMGIGTALLLPLAVTLWLML
jgi:putative effector of murein hydrolase